MGPLPHSTLPHSTLPDPLLHPEEGRRGRRGLTRAGPPFLAGGPDVADGGEPVGVLLLPHGGLRGRGAAVRAAGLPGAGRAGVPAVPRPVPVQGGPVPRGVPRLAAAAAEPAADGAPA